jgi:hypothetical protein
MDAEEQFNHELHNLRRNGDGLELIDWDEVRDPSAEIVEGFALTGRWTATVAGAKVGKSTLLISLSVEVSEGRDPWSGDPTAAVDVLYLDTEMGRVDLEERLGDCGYEPLDLKHWHACELVPRLDVPEGARRVLATVERHGVRLVVIDGLNGTVSGAEKDDTPWRDLYEHMIRPLKEVGCAVVSADNHGKDETLGPRGSSVKLDKADAIMRISRTDSGVSLTSTHRRTAAYHDRIDLDVVDLDVVGVGTRFRLTNGKAWPTGTKHVADILDELGIERDAGRPTIRARLKEAMEGASDPSRYRFQNKVLAAGIAWRKAAKSVDKYVSEAAASADRHRGDIEQVIENGAEMARKAVPEPSSGNGDGTALRSAQPQAFDQGGQLRGTAGTGLQGEGGRGWGWPVGTPPGPHPPELPEEGEERPWDLT